MFLKLNTVVLLRFLDSCCDYVSRVRDRQSSNNMQQDPEPAMVCNAAFCAASRPYFSTKSLDDCWVNHEACSMMKPILTGPSCCSHCWGTAVPAALLRMPNEEACCKGCSVI